MSYCTNDECPHKKRTGKPAEFMDGITTCSDCGSTLSDMSPETEEYEGTRYNSEIIKRVVFTIAMLIVWHLLSYIKLPYVNFSGTPFEGILPYFFDNGRFTIVALGIMPYVSAYILVEIAALFIPFMKRWRQGGYEGRRKLRLTALQTTILIAPLHGLGIATGLESISEGMFVPNPGLKFRLVVSITLTAATFLIIWIADQITKKGIGHGISVLVASSILLGAFTSMPKIPKETFEGPSLLPLAPYALIAVLIVLIYWIEKSIYKVPIKYKSGFESYIPLKWTPAGIVPVKYFVPFIVMLPLTMMQISGSPFWQNVAEMLSPGNAGYFILYFVLTGFFYFLFTAVFNNSEKIVSLLREKNARVIAPEGIKEDDYMDGRLKRLAVLGALYLTFIVLLPVLLVEITDIPMLLSGISLIILVAISLDVINEIKARRVSAGLVKIHESHDIPMAGLMKNVLQEHGIHCLLKGYYHRALFYFFGPYIEISVMVPGERADEANEIIAQYFETGRVSSE